MPERLQSLDILRGIAVAAITFWDFLDLEAVYTDWTINIVGIPLYAIPPILFFVSTGAAAHVSITKRINRGQSWPQVRQHTFHRSAQLVLAGLVLTILLNERIDSWGLFEAITLTNLGIYIVLRYRFSRFTLFGTMLVSGAISPYLLAIAPKWPLPFSFVERMFISGFFPFFPFIGYTLAGVLLMRTSANDSRFKIGLALILAGLSSSIWIPTQYQQGGAYTLSMFLTTTGTVFIIFACLYRLTDMSGHRFFNPLATLGRHALGATFWRYPLLNVPILYLHLDRKLPLYAAIVAAAALLVCIWLAVGIIDKLKPRVGTVPLNRGQQAEA